jgi:hypothetical protein
VGRAHPVAAPPGWPPPSLSPLGRDDPSASACVWVHNPFNVPWIAAGRRSPTKSTSTARPLQRGQAPRENLYSSQPVSIVQRRRNSHQAGTHRLAQKLVSQRLNQRPPPSSRPSIQSDPKPTRAQPHLSAQNNPALSRPSVPIGCTAFCARAANRPKRAPSKSQRSVGEGGRVCS